LKFLRGYGAIVEVGGYMKKQNEQLLSLIASVGRLEILEKEYANQLKRIERRLDAQYEETVKIRRRLDKLEKN
jgi:hypothetical protein